MAVVHAVDPAVDGQWLASCPGVLDHGCVGDVGGLGRGVELAETVEALLLVLDGR